VRVLDAQGAVLASAVRAGETFSLAERAERPDRGSKKPATRVQAGNKAPSANAKALLSEARAAMLRDDRAGARALIEKAEGAQPSRGDRAEAATLRAELSLLERDSAGALRTYRAIAAQYAELPAGENAAFAAAQLAARSSPSEARALLEAYLTRYPNGRFVSQAKQRLERLGAR
jgi:acyl-CoA synthetase (NDP forming)